ncbi:MAG: hypothetical protein MZV63_43060 [Marinilabiliales bacterium]|nr:hypothetical protein [Marinilabiliales bacterium]
MPVTGGTAVRLFSDNYFDQAHNVAELPSGEGKEYYFTTSWESYMFSHRKRYRGKTILTLNTTIPLHGEYKRLTEWEGKDLWPSVDRSGRLYFASDEANDEYNLYTIENGLKKQLTDFPTSIRRPQVSADGRKIVFGHDYRIWTYDVAEKKSSLCDISIWAK